MLPQSSKASCITIETTAQFLFEDGIHDRVYDTHRMAALSMSLVVTVGEGESAKRVHHEPRVTKEFSVCLLEHNQPLSSNHLDFHSCLSSATNTDTFLQYRITT
jgi:hypothetical protein